MPALLIMYFLLSSMNVISEANSITELISINFTDTLPLIDIWPSDGITLKYSLIDHRTIPFEDSSHLVLYTVIDYVDVYNHSSKSMVDNIILNLSQCTCSSSVCIDCQQQLYLFNFLSERDGSRNFEYDFTLSPQYKMNALIEIVPSVMTVHIQRCNVSIYAQEAMSIMSSYIVVPFNFTVPKYCCVRIEEVFAVNISLKTMLLSTLTNDNDHQLLVQIKENGSIHSVLILTAIHLISRMMWTDQIFSIRILRCCSLCAILWMFI
eukprot:231765_1